MLIDDSVIVDIIADQFDKKKFFIKYKPISKSFIGFYDEDYLYSCFRKNRICNIDITSYGSDIPFKLRVVYETIIRQIDENN